jgi:hypothetical protein
MSSNSGLPDNEDRALKLMLLTKPTWRLTVMGMARSIRAATRFQGGHEQKP